MIYVNRLFFNIFQQLRQVYLNSSFYNKKISKIFNKDLIYKPSPHLLSSLIKYQKKIKIEDFFLDDIWNIKNHSKKDYKIINSFNWFFTLDLKSSKKTVQSIISNWINKNYKYDRNSWEFDIVAKRIISWLSCHNLTFEDGSKKYKESFNFIIQKQTNHLINEINRSKLIEDKLIGCASIILVGLCYQNEKNYLSFGINILKKISKLSLDNHGFPKTRNIKQLIFYLKYFILIREWFKESHFTIPEHINETIYFLGQGYAFFSENTNNKILFNGNNISENINFKNYLNRLGYKFKNSDYEYGGYLI